MFPPVVARGSCRLPGPFLHQGRGLKGAVPSAFPPSRAMALALAEAKAAAARGEVPVGAVILSHAGVDLAQAGHRTLVDLDPNPHAYRTEERRCGKEGDSICKDRGLPTQTKKK